MRPSHHRLAIAKNSLALRNSSQASLPLSKMVLPPRSSTLSGGSRPRQLAGSKRNSTWRMAGPAAVYGAIDGARTG
ncbi:hypothetical protein CF319_g5389 [Tilletia indica]|nr:hypothetical protein CF319_g5389 [Tilletia indica]